MPFPIRIILRVADSFLTDFSSEEWAKSIPPITNCFVTNIYASFVEQVLYITKRKRKPDIHHHSETDNLGRCLEIAEGIVVLHPQRLWESSDSVKLGFLWQCHLKYYLVISIKNELKIFLKISYVLKYSIVLMVTKSTIRNISAIIWDRRYSCLSDCGNGDATEN